MLVRSTFWNVALLTRARLAQSIDPSGVSAAAYAISLQLYLVGCIVASALQGTAAAMVASALTRSSTEARRVSERLIGWGLMLGGAVCALQLATLLAVVPLFTPLPQVQNAAFRPTAMAAVVQLVNVPCYAAEGVAIGARAWGALTQVTGAGLVFFMIGAATSSRFGGGLIGVWASIGLLNGAIVIGLATLLYRRGGALGEGSSDTLVSDSNVDLEVSDDQNDDTGS